MFSTNKMTLNPSCIDGNIIYEAFITKIDSTEVVNGVLGTYFITLSESATELSFQFSNPWIFVN